MIKTAIAMLLVAHTASADMMMLTNSHQVVCTDFASAMQVQQAVGSMTVTQMALVLRSWSDCTVARPGLKYRRLSTGDAGIQRIEVYADGTTIPVWMVDVGPE